MELRLKCKPSLALKFLCLTFIEAAILRLKLATCYTCIDVCVCVCCVSVYVYICVGIYISRQAKKCVR